MSLRNTLLAFSLAAITLPGIAMADSASTDTQAGTSPMHHMGPDMTEMMHKHLDHLKTDLHLTDAQQAAWQTFADQAMDSARQAEKERKEMWQHHQENMTNAPAHMQDMADHMAERARMMSKTASAAKNLYAQLSPEQQQTFDHDMAEQRRHMMKRMRIMGMHDGQPNDRSAPNMQ